MFADAYIFDEFVYKKGSASIASNDGQWDVDLSEIAQSPVLRLSKLRDSDATQLDNSATPQE